jgi:hypothetical protein
LADRFVAALGFLDGRSGAALIARRITSSKPIGFGNVTGFARMYYQCHDAAERSTKFGGRQLLCPTRP